VDTRVLMSRGRALKPAEKERKSMAVNGRRDAAAGSLKHDAHRDQAPALESWLMLSSP
jgi:hypothetical protein